MKYKKKQKKYFITILVIVLLLLLIYIFNNKKTYFKIEELTHDLGIYLEDIITPKVTVNYKETISGINKELEKENNELKKMLELKEKSYKIIHADVIKRDNSWYQELTINKGKKTGIDIDMAVISNDRLIGRISSVSELSSTVKLISSNDIKVAVDIDNEVEKYHGIIDNYLESESMLQINNIPKNSNIEVGNKVYTNGLGGIYPTGIYIGLVEAIDYDNLGLNKIIKVKYSYNDIRFVSIIGRET